METIEAVIENGVPLRILPNTEIHFLPDVRDDLEPNRVGFFTYHKGCDPRYTLQRFYLTVDGVAYTVREHKEIDLLVTIGDYLERNFSIEIEDINLPSSHGYSGSTYGYQTTMRLFSHAGIR